MDLAQFERRLERLVEGVFSKAFRSGLQPVEIGRRLARQMDDRRTVGVRGVVAPNRFTVLLCASDRERFAGYEQALVDELADAIWAHARQEKYSLLGQVSVAFETRDDLSPGQFVAETQISADPGGRAASLSLADGRRIPVGERPVVIGRLPECEIPVTDPQVSRRHAEVRRDLDGFRVVDLGSTNGTFVNGARVRDSRLSDGDELRVGSTAMRFEA
ncbi:MAG: FhaA domain-containing protein [Acidimicrobiia bacterium]